MSLLAAFFGWRQRNSPCSAPFDCKATVAAHWTDNLIGLPLVATRDADGKLAALLSHEHRTLKCRLGDLAGKHLSARARAIHIEARPINRGLYGHILSAVQKISLAGRILRSAVSKRAPRARMIFS